MSDFKDGAAMQDSELMQKLQKFNALPLKAAQSLVDHPLHYASQEEGGIDCITAMQHAFGKDAVATFCKLNAFKYIWRLDAKGGLQDAEKAVWYLNKFINTIKPTK